MIDKNEIPESWEVVKLAEVCVIIMGQSPASSTYNKKGVGLPFFQGKKEFTKLHPVVEKWCSEPNKIAEPNDILLSVRAPVGATNIANQKCCIGRGLAAIRFQKNNLFVYYFLKLIEKKLDEKGTGTTFKAISGEVLRETNIPLPPLSEQHRIVTKIEELFTELDKGIETLKTTQQQLKVYRQAVLKWTFEGRLNYDLSDSYDEHDGKPDNQKNHIHQKNHSSDNGLPDGWEWKKLGDVGTWKGGGTPSKAESKYWNDGTILWVSPKDMKSKVIHNTEDKITPEAILNSSAKLIPKDSILFVVRSGILRRALPVALTETEVTVNQDLHALTPFEDSSKYIYWFVVCDGDEIRRRCSKDGTTVESIESQLLKNYLIPIPSRLEQTKIVSAIESRLSVCDKMEETIESTLQQAEALRLSILKKAFEGKLVEQNPEDEPAYLLMKKLRNERMKGAKVK